MTTNSKEYIHKQYKDSANLDSRMNIHGLYSTNRTDWHEWVFDHISFRDHCSIIEFGCGPGSLWEKNIQKVSKDWSITLTDLSPGMLDQARQRTGNLENFTYQVMDIQKIDFPAKAFDVAIANHMLYHVPNINVALTEIKRILKPDGRFYASTNGLAHMREIYELAAEFDPALSFSKPLNAQYFGLENAEAQLSKHFNNVQLIRFDCNLHVSNVHHLAEYMFSIGTKLKDELINSDRYNQFMEFLESKKDERGYIFIAKDTGIFICSDL